MRLFQLIILALVQGVTEFLPISSSGHLVIFQKILNISNLPVIFDILLHLGTLISILIYFKKDILNLLINREENKSVWFMVIVGSIPAIIFGFILKSKIEAIFNSSKFTGVFLIICAILLYSSKFTPKFTGAKKTDLKKINLSDAIIIGIFQAVAIFPGISRSGSTIIGGLWRKLNGTTAFKFSFLLSIPAILGAVLLKAKEISTLNISIFYIFLAVSISAFVGYFSLKYLEKILQTDKFYLFSYYCLAVGLILVFS